ncbi:dihydroxyacetone kinase subunit DhaL [Acetobacteraceae bacterium KSS8]|uniref:Dihydroxyacetone kinase subunit DhaL n=1 Tax=Endosaccharibacter trunci TaxID=2812733 RepID=A0ABT1W591_9PROT|nr:dihydroxyacetone kinase subunit DhaL [Acetobacteraceae bacterium KSS8]
MADRITLSDAAPVVPEIAHAVIDARDHLSEIDGATGDGDHGVNMAKGFRMVLERLDGKDLDLRQGFAVVGDTLLSDIGGSMGPLYGSLFTEMSDTLEGRQAIDVAALAAMLKAAEGAIADLGDAKVGDKTLMDVLVPAREAAEKAEAANETLVSALAAIREAAASGLESTRDLVAKRGRAARLGERSRGVLDAGAASCELILRTLANGLSERLS